MGSFLGYLALMAPAAFLPGLAAGAEAAPESGQLRQEFREDPGWEGFRNRLVPHPPPRTRQDFGHSSTRHAGGAEAGEVGGWIKRSTTPAWYARVIPERGLETPLLVTGRFAVRRAEGGSGMLIGWFRHTSRGWRTPDSLAIRLDGNGGNCWVLFEYGTRGWSTGGGATFEGRYQTTSTPPLPADGKSHPFSLAYDPAGAGGRGEIVFTLGVLRFAAALAPGHREEGAAFDRFGMFNQQITGDGMEVYFDDLVIDGRPEDFSGDPGWEGRGNRAEFEDRALRPFHDFGYSPTAHAGGEPGEVGGLIWRDEAPAFYGKAVGPLSLSDDLSASGRIVFRAAGSDSAVYFGWFEAGEKKEKKTPEHESPQRSILGLLIEGQSRVGHYIRPAYRDSSGEGAILEKGPLIRPDGKAHRWSIRYGPRSRGGKPGIDMTFDGEAASLDLDPAHFARGASFDRFGLFNVQSGGHHVELYLDDLAYTAGPR